MDRSEQSAFSTIFRNKLFWIALGAVFLIHLNNGISLWSDEQWPRIPTAFTLAPIKQKYPEFALAPWSGSLLDITFYPVAVGFSYFLASEVSLSLGLTQVIFVAISLVLMTYGVEMQSDYVAGGVGGWQRFGSYLALALVFLYTGRRYYFQVLSAAFSLRPRDGVDRYATWALRVLLAALTILVSITVSLGLSWPMAVIFFLLMLMMYTCLTRVNAETGLFFIQPRWQPLGVMIGFFGGYGMGPESMVIVGMLGTMLCIDISMSLMPYFSNCLKLCENLRLRPSRAILPAGATWLVAATLGLVVGLWASYNYGMGTRRDLAWGFNRVTTFIFDVPNKEVTKLTLSGELEQSIKLTSLQRLSEFRPDGRFLVAAGAGVALVLLFGALRLRLSWWPLHPVMFLVWDTFPMSSLSHSFLIGYFVKTVVSRLGGHKTYQKAKPFMIGLIAGDLLGVMLWMAVSAIYYLATGIEPKIYKYYPK